MPAKRSRYRSHLIPTGTCVQAKCGVVCADYVLRHRSGLYVSDGDQQLRFAALSIHLGSIMSTVTANLASLSSTAPLNNGLKLPVIGLGVYLTEPGATTKEAVLSALKLGYRHVDTAQFYQNEADVGAGVRDSGVPRDQVWITSKVFPQLWQDPNTAFDKTLAAVQESVKRIGYDFIDLMLLHAPGDAQGRLEAWRALEQAHNQVNMS
eukprot:GHRR01018349.1.p1 GENE.GHRR01018349.1~~GHRR01018349.1.p1  ORF type:complete len:208 (+),score=17.02 GHRR01018349.1:26-649(+)